MVKSFNTWFTGLFSYGWFGGGELQNPQEDWAQTLGAEISGIIWVDKWRYPETQGEGGGLTKLKRWL